MPLNALKGDALPRRPPRGNVLIQGTRTLNTVYWTEGPSGFILHEDGAARGSGGGRHRVRPHAEAVARTVDGVHLVNTGSVGRPKDGDPRAGHVVVAAEGRNLTLEFVRVAYDVARAAAAIRSNELPGDFATFLERGGAGGRRSVSSADDRRRA